MHLVIVAISGKDKVVEMNLQFSQPEQLLDCFHAAAGVARNQWQSCQDANGHDERALANCEHRFVNDLEKGIFDGS